MASKPDYIIGALDKARDLRQSRVGAAWINPDGTISITLDPFVHLQGGPELALRLFPNKDKSDTSGAGEESADVETTS